MKNLVNKKYERLELDLNYNKKLLVNQESHLSVFSGVTRKKQPYFLKANKKRINFVESFHDVKIFENRPQLGRWAVHKNKTRSKKIADAVFFKHTLRELTKTIKYSVIVSQLQRNNHLLEKLNLELFEKHACPVGINGYFTPQNDQTFPIHYDLHDTIILQVFGTKRWKVYDANPKNNFKQEVIIDIVLNPGDMLFIPTGYYHEARAEDVFSFHFTFGLYACPLSTLKDWSKKLYCDLNTHRFTKKDFTYLNYLFYLKTFKINEVDKGFLVFKNMKTKKLHLMTREGEVILPFREKNKLKRIVSDK